MSKYNPAANELNHLLNNGVYNNAIHPIIKEKITKVLEGIKHTDEMISQKDHVILQKDSVIKEKDTELQSINHILAQKDIENQIAREALLRTEMLLSRAELSGFEAIRNEAIKMIEKAPNELALYKAYLHKTKGWLLEYEYLKDKAIEKNDHGQYGVEFWERQIVEQNGHANSCLEAIKDEADKIRNNATSELDHLKADLVNNEYWRLSYEFHRDIAVLKNNHGEYGIEFWGNKITECDNIEKHVLEALKKSEEDGKSTNKQLLNDKEQEIAKFKELLSIREHELQEKQELLLAKELEKQELLAQKENEVHNKSMVKNQIIGDLQGALSSQEQEAYKLQIELLTKQLEAAREIAKQKGINTELVEQNEILGLKIQYYDMEVRNKETEKEILLTQKQKMTFLLDQKNKEFQNALIQKEIEQKELLLAKELAVADKSFEKNQIIEQLREEIEGLSKQLLDNQPIYRSIYLEDRSCQPGESLVERQMESLDLSSINLSPINQGGQNQNLGILNNLSPNVHVGNNPVQNPLAFINDFDINNVHTTNSVYPSGEGSESFVIVDTENIH